MWLLVPAWAPAPGSQFPVLALAPGSGSWLLRRLLGPVPAPGSSSWVWLHAAGPAQHPGQPPEAVRALPRAAVHPGVMEPTVLSWARSGPESEVWLKTQPQAQSGPGPAGVGLVQCFSAPGEGWGPRHPAPQGALHSLRKAGLLAPQFPSTGQDTSDQTHRQRSSPPLGRNAPDDAPDVVLAASATEVLSARGEGCGAGGPTEAPTARRHGRGATAQYPSSSSPSQP